MGEEHFDPAFDERTWEDIFESSGIEDRETVKMLASSSYEFFLEHALGLNTESPLIQEAIDLVENPPEQEANNGRKTAIMAPRGHSKTYSYTVGRTLWIAYTESSRRIILTSASRDQSKGILEKVKRIIERNAMLKFLKPSTENRKELADTMSLKDDEEAWAAKTIVTTTDVTVKTKTFGSSIRSEHVDYVFCDDILQDKKNGSRSKQDEKDVFYEVISPIIENKGGTLQVVGTPTAHDDLMMELMSKSSYYTTKYKAYDTETKEPLWPWMWSYEGLMNKKEEIGPAKFAREYMCDPMSVEEQFFSWDEAVHPNLDQRFKQDHWKVNIDDSYEDWQFFLGVDIALSTRKGADYTVMQVLGRDPEGRTWHVDIYREKGMTPTSIAKKIKEFDEKYRFSKGLVEKNAIGEGVWDTIKQEASLSGRIQSFDTTRKTRPEILSQLQAALHRNEIVLHNHEATIDEMLGFYMNDSGKLEGKGHDDCVMSLAIAWKAARRGDYAPTSMTIISEDGEELNLDLDKEFERDVASVEIDDDELEGVGIV